METILLLIGRLNYTWTNTESLLIYLMAFLMRTDKEAAVVVFLTLNTTRARLDLVERLAKMSSTPAETRQRTLQITSHMKKEARLRNKYNHCVYSFDEEGSRGQTQLMRIAESEHGLRYGKVDDIDDQEMQNIIVAIENITSVNHLIWDFMRLNNIHA